MKEVVPVSVVIPTYNRERFVVEAVESVLKQRFLRPLEIIVVDDGSFDATFENLRNYIKRGDIVYLWQENKGVSGARNRGIEASRGEWIAFLDSDDLWLPKKLYYHWLFCVSNKDILISQTDEIWLKDGRVLNPKKYHKKPAGYCFERLLERCLISPSAVMVHRKVFETVGYFDENFFACEDYELWLRIGYRFPIGFVDKKLVVKRGGHGDQLSYSIKMLDRYRILAIAKLILKEPLTSEQKGFALAELRRKCLIYGKGALKRGKEKEYAFCMALPDLVEKGLINIEGLKNENCSFFSNP